MSKVIKEGYAVNPKTLRQVKVGGAVYNRLVKQGKIPDLEIIAEKPKESEPVVSKPIDIPEAPKRRRRTRNQ